MLRGVGVGSQGPQRAVEPVAMVWYRMIWCIIVYKYLITQKRR
jgi:hypothetical protein